MTRIAIQDFSLANPLYIGKTLSFYTVDANGAKTSTLAALYAGPTGTDLLENPQELDSEGKTRTPVYIEDPVIGVVTGLAAGDTETGIIPITGRNRGTWQAGTIYYPTEIFQNKEGGGKDGNWYVSSKTHTAGVFDDDLSNGLFILMLDVHQIANDFVIPPVQALIDQAQAYRDEAQTAAQNTYSVFKYTATGGETSLSGPDDNANTLAYVPGVIIVEMNGALLEGGVDFTAINGTSITGLAALSVGDVVTIRAFGSFDVTTHETKTGGVHGVVGAFVGTENVQTLLNKILQSTVFEGRSAFKGDLDLTVDAATGVIDFINIINSGGAKRFGIAYDADTVRLLFTDRNGAELIALDESTGRLDLSGAGAYLGGTAAANLLDDYEEGTFTPAISLGYGTTAIAYAKQSGEYTKVGNVIMAVTNIQLSSKGTDTGTLRITGLPFAAKSNTLESHVQPYITGLNTSANCTMYVPPGSASPLGVKFDGGVSATLLTDADIANNSNIRVTFIYHAE